MSFRAITVNAFWALSGHVMSRGALMVSAIILARNLSSADYAAFSYFNLTVTMLASYAAVGLGVTASRFFAQFQPEKLETYHPVRNLLILSVILSMLSFVAVYLLPNRWLNLEVSLPQWLIALGVAAAAACVVPSGAILGLERYREASIISLISGVVVILFSLVAVHRESVTIAAWALIFGFIIQLIGQLAIIFNSIAFGVVFNRRALAIRELLLLLHFAGPMFLVSIIAGSGSWIVGRFLLKSEGNEGFAVYSIGLQWFALGSLIPGIISRVTFPQLIRNSVNDNKLVLYYSTAMAAGSVLVVALIAFTFSKLIIGMYGPLYVAYSAVIPLFLLLAAISAPINIIGNAVVAKNGQIYWLAMTIFSFTVLMTVVLFVPKLNVWWAVAAHSLSSVLMLVLVTIIGRLRKVL